MKMLLTAFEPFGGEKVNPALEVLRRLPDSLAGLEIIKLEVPTVFGTSLEVVQQAVRRYRPDAVLSLGQAGGRRDMTVERVAINLMDTDMADNQGRQPLDEPIVPGGPAAHFATLPVKAMVQAMLNAGVPASLSYTAGAFVCNQLMYGVLHAIAMESSGAIAGFVHVPYVPEQTAGKRPPPPSMPLADMLRGVEAGIRAIACAMPPDT